MSSPAISMLSKVKRLGLMDRLVKQTIFIGLLGLLGLHTVKAEPMPVPAAPQVNAKSYLLMDAYSGKILAEKKKDERFEPASITKLMAAYVIYNEIESGRLSLEDKVTISEKAWRMGGSKMFVEVGNKVLVDDLLNGMVIQSGNDATVALAEHVAGSEDTFASYMNQYAQRLGMTNSHFVNSTGWPAEGHLTSAWDIAILARAMIKEFPKQYERYSEKSFTYNDITQHNRNQLLWRDKSVDGIKTGHTEAAGYCLVSSAKRDQMRLIAVVLGTTSEKARADASQALLNYGFRFFESHKLYDAGKALNETRIWQGDTDLLALGLHDDLYVTIPTGQYKNLEAKMDIDSNITAPVQKGQEVGVVKVSFNGDEVVSVPLVALHDVGEGSFFQRTKDSILKYFQ